MSETVKEWYDARAEYEWIRLFQDGYHQLEYIITMHFLEKHLPPKGLILDAGGGPGRYTIELAKKGYDVVLLDLSPRCLEIARREVKNAGVEARVKEIVEGSVVDLSKFPDEFFDAVLCLGPLLHLIRTPKRQRAASELVRIARKGAPLFISVINRYGVFRTALQRYPEELVDSRHKEMFSKGIHRAHHKDPNEPQAGFTDAYFFLPNELKELFESRGVKTLETATCEGLSSHLQEATNTVYKDKQKWEKWLKILLKTCTDPCIIGLGEHLLYVGEKL